MKITRRQLLRLIKESTRANSGQINMIAQVLTSNTDVSTLRQFFALAIGLGHALPDSFSVNDLIPPPIVGMTVSKDLFHAINQFRTIHHYEIDPMTRMYKISYSI